MKSTSGTITYCLTFGQNDHEVEVEIDYDLTAGEDPVMYLKNGDPGYPGSPAFAEYTRIKVTAFGEHTRDDSWVWALLDDAVQDHLDKNWEDAEAECFEDANQDYIGEW